MANVKKTKTIHYKNVVLSSGQALEPLLRSALDANGSLHKPALRQQKLNEEDSTVIFINRFSEHQGMLIGQLVYLETGKHQPYITLDDSAEYYTIDALSSELIPEEEGGEETKKTRQRKRKEFIDSILYFGVIENHLVVIQSAALNSRHLEAHLAWLLGASGNIENSTTVSLQDKPSESVFKRLEQTPAKSIHVGAPLASPTEKLVQSIPSKKTDTIGAKSSKIRFSPFGDAANLINAIVPDFLKGISLEDSLDEANIQVFLEIKYNRKTSESGQAVMDQIATSLRHNPTSDVTINLKGGGRITGDELKLSGSIRLEFLPSGLISEASLFHEMHQWLYDKIGSNEIDTSTSIE